MAAARKDAKRAGGGAAAAAAPSLSGADGGLFSGRLVRAVERIAHMLEASEPEDAAVARRTRRAVVEARGDVWESDEEVPDDVIVKYARRARHARERAEEDEEEEEARERAAARKGATAALVRPAALQLPVGLVARTRSASAAAKKRKLGETELESDEGGEEGGDEEGEDGGGDDVDPAEIMEE